MIIYIFLILLLMCITFCILIDPKSLNDTINGLENTQFIIKKNSMNECFYELDNKIISFKRIVENGENHLFFNNNILDDEMQKINVLKNNFTFNFSTINRLPRGMNGPEDPRIIELNNEIIVIYNDSFDNDKIRLFLYNFTTKNNVLLNYQYSNNIEKNWSPFIYKNILYVSYSINPHIILKVNIQNGDCQKIYENPKFNSPLKIYGGTPSIYIKESNFYLGIAHLNIQGLFGWKRIYYCVSYIFSPEPPFQIQKISKIFTFKKRNNYVDLLELHIVDFPIGLQKINDFLYISLGLNDTESNLIKINYQDFINQVF